MFIFGYVSLDVTPHTKGAASCRTTVFSTVAPSFSESSRCGILLRGNLPGIPLHADLVEESLVIDQQPANAAEGGLITILDEIGMDINCVF